MAESGVSRPDKGSKYHHNKTVNLIESQKTVLNLVLLY